MTIQPTNSEFQNDITRLYGDYPGALPFILPDNDVIEVQTISDIPDGARPLPYSHAGLFFCVGLIEDADRDEYLSCKLKPTLVYYHAGRREQILVWSLKEPVQLEGPWKNLPDIFGMDLNVGIPLHGDDGWEIVYPGIDRYAPGELVAAYGPDAGTKQEEQPIESVSKAEVKIEKKFFDADIKSGFNPDDYPGTIKVTLGKNSKSTYWATAEMPLGNVLGMLCRHEEGKKDGNSFVFADMVAGQRLKSAVKNVTAIALDIDTGTPTEEIDTALATLKCLAVRYTTHSHNKTKSEFKKDEIRRFEPDTEEIDSDLMRRYVAQKKNLVRSIVETVEYDDVGHGPNGIMVRIKHAPIPKNRIVIPLLHPFEITGPATAQKEAITPMEAMAKWAKYIEAMAAKLKVPFDLACTDPSRLFFLPRHDEGRISSATIFGGPLFDLKSLQLDNQFDAFADAGKRKGKQTSTEAGKKLIPRLKPVIERLQLAELVRDHARENRSNDGIKVSPPCPFEDAHTEQKPGDSAFFVMNAGDGDGPLPVAFCHHAGCQDKNVYDFVAQMMAIGWFEEEELFDESYFPQMWDDEKEICPTPPDWVWGASSDHGQAAQGSSGEGDLDQGQKAICDGIMSDIGLHDPKSNDNAQNARALVQRMIDAKADSSWVIDAKNKLASRSGLGRTEINKIYNELKPKEAKTDQTKKAQSKQEIAVCERLGCTVLFYPHAFVHIEIADFDGRPYMFEKHDNFSEPLGAPIVAAKSVRYADRDQEHGLRVKFLTADNECVTVDFPARDLVKNRGNGVLEKLKAGGWKAGEKGEEFALEYLKHASAPSVTVHDNGGWKPAGYLFRSGVSVPAGAGLEISADAGLIGPHASIGTLEGALAATKKLFVANPQLESLQFCYLAGLAGTVVSAAKDKPLQYAPEGPTSCGKTTGAEFGLSHYGDCRENNEEKKQGGMLYTANSTVNAFALMLKRSSGGALGIDDFNQQKAEVQQKAVFMGHAMTDKIRMNKDSTEKPTPSWGPGTIFYMGEIGMSQRLSQENVTQLGGLSVRVFPVTFSEENKIKDLKTWEPIENLIRNFGHTGPAFISTMIAQNWHSDPERIENVIKKLTKMLLGPEDFADVQKRRAGRMAAYPLFVALLCKRAGIVPKDFNAFALCKSLWNKFLESDLAPVAPAKRGIDILVNRLMGNRGGEVRHIADGGDGDDDKVRNRGEAFAYYGAWVTICPADGPTKDGVPVPVPLSVYVIRADKIAEMAGGAMDKKALLEELENQGYVVRNPKTPSQRTWNNFPKLGQVQYVVLRADKIDAS